MFKFTLYRIIQAIPSLIGITIISFILIHIVPGGPAQAMLGTRATPAKIAAINHQLGLNKPIYIQYITWFNQLLHGNFGMSYFYNKPVLQLIAINLPRTLAVVGIGILIAHVLSVFVGTLQAYYRDTKLDHTVTGFAYFFYSMPYFWLGLILISVFSVNLGWFPSGGLNNPLNPSAGFGNWLSHITLPIVTLVVGTVAGWGRYMRTSMIDTMVQDYIRTARAKGLSEFWVVFKHALRNSLLPLITLLGYSLPFLLSYGLVIESVFNYPGMGLLYWNAALQRDYPIVLGIIVITGVLTILGNLLADLLYAIVDPRVQYR